MVSRLVRLPRLVSEEFGGWIAYFRRQGVWHGLVWLACEVRGPVG